MKNWNTSNYSCVNYIWTNTAKGCICTVNEIRWFTCIVLSPHKKLQKYKNPWLKYNKLMSNKTQQDALFKWKYNRAARHKYSPTSWSVVTCQKFISVFIFFENETSCFHTSWFQNRDCSHSVDFKKHLYSFPPPQSELWVRLAEVCN